MKGGKGAPKAERAERGAEEEEGSWNSKTTVVTSKPL